MENLTVGEIVKNDFRSANIFKRFGIDYCCGGKQTLEAACSKKKINPSLVQTELNKLQQSKTPQSLHFGSWEPGFLCDYIVNEHHQYVRNAMPFIIELAKKVASVHGHMQKELFEIERIFNLVASELNFHMVKEEIILFPFIKTLEKNIKLGNTPEEAVFGSVENPIKMMEMEHESAGEGMYKINELCNGYHIPENACNSFSVLYQSLEEFEDNLHQHVHLENNILFPKAIKLQELAY
jgi:regulator of cell morphogenesis and NO signaling